MALNPKLILPTVAYFSCDISHRCSDIGFLEFTQDETSNANIESGKTAASGIQVDAHSCRRALHRMRLVCDACGPRSLAMVDGIAVLVFPETCGSEEHCISACRDNAIQMTWLPHSGDRAAGKWQECIQQA